MKKIALITVMILMASSMLFGCSIVNTPDLIVHEFSSKSQISRVIDGYTAMWQVSGIFKRGILGGAIEDTANSTDYTPTNVQVEGVDEGDVVKVDGASIFKLTGNGFVIVNASNGQMEIASEIEIENFVPREMYLVGNKAIVIGGRYEEYDIGISRDEMPLVGCCFWPSETKTDIRVYDVTDRAAPILERQIVVDGSYNTSRIVDGKLIFMISYYFSHSEEEFIPKISDSSDDGVEKEIALENLYYFTSIPSFSYLVVGNIEIANPENGKVVAYLGVGGEIAVSENNIYVLDADYSSRYINFLWWTSYSDASIISTRIVKIANSSLEFVGAIRVEGTCVSRYSADEYDGNLRVATTTSWWTENLGSRSYSSVFVLDQEMKVIGTVSNIAPGERIYSVRFNGTTGSLVTFEQVDPLYKLDLSSPTSPSISEGLKEDGVSMYLHYIDDTYMIGVGRDSEVVNGRVNWKGIKVSLYDVTGEEAVELNTIIIDGDWTSADIFYNPKALLYDYDRNIFAFTGTVWESVFENGYETSVLNKQALFVFGFAGGVLTLDATLSDNTSFVYDDWYEYYDMSFSFIERGARIGDYIYTISETQITSYAISTFEKTSEITICEFVPASERFAD